MMRLKGDFRECKMYHPSEKTFTGKVLNKRPHMVLIHSATVMSTEIMPVK